MKCSSVIMAISQENRVDTAVKVQDVLTKYGCNIRVRLGLHNAVMNQCTNTGMILLQLCGEDFSADELEKELLQIPEVKVKYMQLDF